MGEFAVCAQPVSVLLHSLLLVSVSKHPSEVTWCPSPLTLTSFFSCLVCDAEVLIGGSNSAKHVTHLPLWPARPKNIPNSP